MTSSRLNVVLLLAGALIGGVAQAQQPSQNSKSTAAGATASSPAASQAARNGADDKAAAVQAAKAAAAKRATEQLIKDARYAGFKPEHIGGKLMFCRTAVELESAFPVRTCYDELQVSIKIEQYRTQRNELEALHHIQ